MNDAKVTTCWECVFNLCLSQSHNYSHSWLYDKSMTNVRNLRVNGTNSTVE